MRSRVRLPNGWAECYSVSSTGVENFLPPGAAHSLAEFVRRGASALAETERSATTLAGSAGAWMVVGGFDR